MGGKQANTRNKYSNGFLLPGFLDFLGFSIYSLAEKLVLVISAFRLIFIDPGGAVGGAVWEIK